MKDKCRHFKANPAEGWVCCKEACTCGRGGIAVEKKDFAARFKMCEFDEVCPKASPYGNTYYKLTSKEIGALLRGEVLYDVEEYGTFIMLKEEDDAEADD